MSESIASADRLMSSFRVYRDYLENNQRQQSIEAEGIFDFADFQRIINLPDTKHLPVRAEGTTYEMPILTPLANHSNCFNENFYRRVIGPGQPLMYYNHLSAPYRQSPRRYTAALAPCLQQLAAEQAYLVLDHTDLESTHVVQELRSVAHDSQVTLREIGSEDGPLSTHYHYASTSQPVKEPAGLPSTLYDAYQAGVANGSFADSSVTVTPTLSQNDIDQIWDFYEPVFEELTTHDPVHAGLGEADFAALMSNPQCAKFVYKAGEAVVNLCLLSDVRECAWMNQFYYRLHHAEAYERGLVLCSPGVIANPDRTEVASSIRTMSMVGKVIALAGIEPVITFACDTISNKQVPRLSERSMLRGGLQTDFSQPVGHQLFRMFAVTAQ